MPCNTIHRILVEDFYSVKLLDWVNDSVAVRSRQRQPCSVRGSSQVKTQVPRSAALLVLTLGEVTFVFMCFGV